MSYDNQMMISHVFPNIDFGAAADVASSFQGPAGKVGRIEDVIVTATEIFTTGGDVEAGIAAAGADYVNMPLSTLAATDTLLASDVSGALVLRDLPADTQIEVTFNQTGGTPTGIATVTFVVGWY